MIINKRAIVYVRVSTDEQNNGYSPADQKARLIKYCENNNIEIVGLYHEDASGKTFNRPEYLKIISFLKKNRNTVDVMLFIKWDRFSRNIGKAYIAIEQLFNLGVEPQAIEQPLNLEIPEQKLMLALYLAAPEVDNDRRALNIFHGYRRGKKMGLWLGGCLRGYKNTRDENNKAVITPEGGKMEQLVVEAFKQFATGTYAIEDLRRKLFNEGLKCHRCSFWALLRNKGYIGKVFVPAYKDEPAEWVQGKHKPLIDEHTFYAVQDILDGRRKKIPSKNKTLRDEFPLRGFLECPKCGRNMTASASRGTGGVFYYYHCSNGCKERQKAPLVNESFLKVLEAVKLNEASKELHKTVLGQLLHGNNQSNKQEVTIHNKDIEKQTQRLKNARALMLDGEILPDEYRQMKIEIEEMLEKLNVQVAHLKDSSEDFTEQIIFCILLFQNIDIYYDTASTEVKQKIISSIFPEKLIFNKNAYRTNSLNDAIALLCAKDKQSKGGKKEKHTIFDVLSCGVAPLRIELRSKV